jgi:hypothetical protein
VSKTAIEHMGCDMISKFLHKAQTVHVRLLGSSGKKGRKSDSSFITGFEDITFSWSDKGKHKFRNMAEGDHWGDQIGISRVVKPDSNTSSIYRCGSRVKLALMFLWVINDETGRCFDHS